MSRLARAAYFGAPILLCLAFYWRAPFVWFRIDDFALLHLSKQIRSFNELVTTLFMPIGQGTVRFLSERAYFIALRSLFGIEAWPFRIAALLTWFAILSLVQLVCRRLTGSRAAGLLAALLLSINAVASEPLVWAAAYNQLLCAFLVLIAFYARLRWLDSGNTKWRILEGGAFVLGFGAVETIVMYPFAVLLHAILDERARARWRSAIWMVVCSILFASIHLVFIPKTESPIYQRIIDGRLPATVGGYASWVIAPWLIHPGAFWGVAQERILLAALAAALAIFAFQRLRKHDLRPLFMAGWFLIWLAPMMPLPNHITTYYSMMPGIGFAWLAGWAIASAWRAGIAWRIVAVTLTAGYLAGTAHEVKTIVAWSQEATAKNHALANAIRSELAAHPKNTILVENLDGDTFIAGLGSMMDFALDASVWLPPDSDKMLSVRPSLTRFKTTQQQVRDTLNVGTLRVIDISGPDARDITDDYLATHNEVPSKVSSVDVGQATFERRLGEGWYTSDNGTRWSGKVASVQLDIPDGGKELRVTGYAPEAILKSGPLTVEFAVNGQVVGAITPPPAGGAVEGFFRLPVGSQGSVSVELRCSKTFRPANDQRDLGLVFGTFTVR